MKINAINNTIFKGQFIDKTKENGGVWRMEYHPYSWETSKANKTKFSVYDSVLPWNEEIYHQILPEGATDTVYESSTDILGTESYLKDIRHGGDILHRDIVDCPKLNLEESLKVLGKKYANFLIMKRKESEELYTEAQKRYDQTSSIKREHEKYVSDVTKGWSSHQYDKYARANGLREGFGNLKSIAQQILNKMAKSKQLTDSILDVYEAQKWIKEELEKIALAKANNNYVDLSVYTEKAIKQEVDRLRQVSSSQYEKLIALPNMTVPLQKLLPQSVKLEKYLSEGFRF